MSVSDAVRRTAEFFTRSADDDVRRAVGSVIRMIDPSGSITTQPGNWAVAIDERILFYKRTFNGRPLSEAEYMFLTFHEGGHLLHTQNVPYPDGIAKPKAFKRIWNACEDMRMERMMVRQFPGFAKIRDTVGGNLQREAAQARMPDIYKHSNALDASWLSAMNNEYTGRWKGDPRNPPMVDPYQYDFNDGTSFCEDTHDLYRQAAEQQTMQNMMPFVKGIYDVLFPDDAEGDDAQDPDEGEQEQEGEQTEQDESEPTEGDDEQGDDDTEGEDGESGDNDEQDDTEGDDSAPGEGDEGEQDDEDGDDGTEGGDTEGDDDDSDEGEGGEGGESDDSDSDDAVEGDTEGEGDGEQDGDADGTEGEGDEDGESSTEGEAEGSGTGEDEQDASEQDDDPTEGENDGDDSQPTEGELMEPENLWNKDDEFDEPEPLEPHVKDGAWREFVLDGASNKFATIMRSMLRKNDTRGKRRNVAFGKMDVSRAYRMNSPIYDYNVFTRRVDPLKPRYALIISVDTSGSMCSYMGTSTGVKQVWEVALQSAATLCEAWNQLRLPWTLFGWGSRVNYVVNDGTPEWQLDLVTTRGDTGGGTDEWVAIHTALDLAMHYGALGFQPIWFHISDGDAYSTDQEGLDKFVDTFGKDHVYFIGIGVGSRQGAKFPNEVAINDADGLYDYMNTTIRRQIYTAVL